MRSIGDKSCHLHDRICTGRLTRTPARRSVSIGSCDTGSRMGELEGADRSISGAQLKFLAARSSSIFESFY